MRNHNQYNHFTDEQWKIMTEWNITEDDVCKVYGYWGESLQDSSNLWNDNEDDRNFAKLYPNLYREDATKLIPHDNIILLSCIETGLFLNEIKEQIKKSTRYAIVSRAGFPEWLPSDDDYTGGCYNMSEFLEYSGNQDDWVKLLVHAINKSNHIKVNWFILTDWMKKRKIEYK